MALILAGCRVSVGSLGTRLLQITLLLCPTVIQEGIVKEFLEARIISAVSHNMADAMEQTLVAIVQV